jgi:hypothetical protein
MEVAMAEAPKRPHRPARFADLTALIDAAGGNSPRSRAEVAASAAQALLDAAAGGERDRLVGLADAVGIDTLAELWRDCEPVSLPGALWILYLLRQWCRSSPDEVARLWREGEPYATPDAVVAGAGLHPDRDAMLRLADSILGSAYGGDFAIALERAAAFFRVIAAGRREGTPGPGDGFAPRNDRVARDLAAAAAAWRAGALH